MNIEPAIRQYVDTNLLYGADGVEYDDQQSFLEAGIIDSLGVMELVGFVTTTFGLTVPAQDITPDNFDSVARLAAYVRRRSVAAA
jgi:acyl carrier protein